MRPPALQATLQILFFTRKEKKNTQTWKIEQCQLWRRKKNTQLSFKWRLQSKCVFMLSRLLVTGPGDAIFVTLTAGGVVCFKWHLKKGNVAQSDQTIISRTVSLIPSSETQTQRKKWARKCPVVEVWPENHLNPSWETLNDGGDRLRYSVI